MMMHTASQQVVTAHLDPASLHAANSDVLYPRARSLGADARDRAVNFILREGTNLQRERYLYHFTDTPNNNVIAALSHYQNHDGGFGKGIEPDLRTRHSSVVGTVTALRILDSVGALHTSMASQAISYLINQYDGQHWFNIGPDCNDAPHAPWWLYETPQPDYDFNANPGAEVLSYLLRHRAMPSETPDIIWRAMEDMQREDLDMHELLGYNRLYESGCLDEDDREHMLPHLLAHAYRLVKVKAWDWEEYCLSPLSLIEHPDSVFTRFFGDAVEANLDFVVDQQNEDGSWSPNWAWAAEVTGAFKTVETEIRAELTLKNLLQLDQFGRL